MSAIATAFEADYVKVLDALAFMEPSVTRLRLTPGYNILAENIIMVGTNEGIPFILTRQFTPSMQDGKIVIASSGSVMNNRLPAGATEHAYGGVFTDIVELLRDEARSLPGSSLLSTSQFLVEYQIGKTPEVSGYPVEAVEITAEGTVKWFSCEAVCNGKQQLSVVQGK